MEILTKEKLVGAKTAPTAVSKTFTPLITKGSQVSLVRIHFSHNQNQTENRQTLGVGVESGS